MKRLEILHMALVELRPAFAAIAVMAALLMSACPPTPPPAPIPSPDMSDMASPVYQACSSTMQLPMPGDVCDGQVTAEGLSCVHCPNAQSCLDAQDVIYCISTSKCEKSPGIPADIKCLIDTGQAAGDASSLTRHRMMRRK